MGTISHRDLNLINWSTIIILTIAFWLSGIAIIDLVIVPSLSAAGMMSESSFASAGFILFGVFNHIEVICAAIILAGVLSFSHLNHRVNLARVILGISLLAITLVDTYFLTPQMSGLGLSLNLFETESIMSPMMIYMHQGYWLLELVKIAAGVFLLFDCYKQEKAI